MVKAETHNYLSKYWEYGTYECSALNGIPLSFTSRPRKHHRRWSIKTVRAGAWEECYKILSSRSLSQCTFAFVMSESQKQFGETRKYFILSGIKTVSSLTGMKLDLKHWKRSYNLLVLICTICHSLERLYQFLKSGNKLTSSENILYHSNL